MYHSLFGVDSDMLLAIYRCVYFFMLNMPSGGQSMRLYIACTHVFEFITSADGQPAFASMRSNMNVCTV